MKKTILTLIVVLATMTYCNAQKIEMEKVFGGYKYSQNESMLMMKDLVKIMESNQQAYELIKKAQSNNSVASIFGGTGGFLVGLPIGTALGGGDAEWALAGIGVGLIAIGIPFSSSANKNAKQAVEVYNSSLNSSAYKKRKPEFKVMHNGSGIGFSINF